MRMMHSTIRCLDFLITRIRHVVHPSSDQKTLKTSVTLHSPLLWASLLMLVLLGNACKKDPIEVGLEVQPVEDRINVFFQDTTTLLAFSRANDSVRTDETSLSLIGSQHDPVFGLTTAGFYSQFLLSNLKPDFGTDPLLDSMILSLSIEGYYGDPQAMMTIKVYELSEGLDYDSSYFSHNSLAYDPIEISSLTFQPKPRDSVMIDSVMYPPHIRINLSQNPILANKILNASATDLESNEKFVELVKGLYITAENATSGGSILYLKLSSTLSKINLYYSNTEKDSLTYQFRIDDGCARFNRFIHDYSYGSQEFKAQITGNDTSLGAQALYLQSMQGITTYIHFPYLESWTKNTGIAITRAELVMPVTTGRRNLKEPAQLLIGAFYDNAINQIPDQTEGSSFIGGTYDEVKQEYRFRVTRHIQQILSGTAVNHPLAILVSSRAVQGNRVIIKGTAMNPRTRLEITYIEVPK